MDDDLKKLKFELARSLRGLSADQTQLSPADNPEKWTIQHIIEHLILTYESTHAMLRDRLIKGVPTSKKVTPFNVVAQFFLLTLGFFPKERQAPQAVVPAVSSTPLSGDELRVRAFAALSDLDRVLEANYRLFGNNRCANHFVLGPLSALQWYRFHFVHGRHHTRQIESIRQQHGIPSSDTSVIG